MLGKSASASVGSAEAFKRLQEMRDRSRFSDTLPFAWILPMYYSCFPSRQVYCTPSPLYTEIGQLDTSDSANSFPMVEGRQEQ